MKVKNIIMPVLFLLAAMLTGCTKQTQTPTATQGPTGLIHYAEGRELMCEAETEERAQEIAELYGIELVEYREGLAAFHTEEDPGSVKKRGMENGWPTLEINVVTTLS